MIPDASDELIDQRVCYLCGSRDYTVRPGRVRDNPSLRPLECSACGLVRLSSFNHIDGHFYEDFHMHDAPPCDPYLVQVMGDEDDYRRFHDFYRLFAGKNLLDFGCGSGGFLSLAKTRAATALGLEPDRGWAETHRALGVAIVHSLSGVSPDSRFDLITMFHVLEHIADPLLLLGNIKKYLNKKIFK
jgi:2-polyprenyl-3-methyl-5-hydroxy-6-metoxy-1,4-benzoquinol methylase